VIPSVSFICISILRNYLQKVHANGYLDLMVENYSTDHFYPCVHLEVNSYTYHYLDESQQRNGTKITR
jgi:hypothetical protein